MGDRATTFRGKIHPAKKGAGNRRGIEVECVTRTTSFALHARRLPMAPALQQEGAWACTPTSRACPAERVDARQKPNPHADENARAHRTPLGTHPTRYPAETQWREIPKGG